MAALIRLRLRTPLSRRLNPPFYSIRLNFFIGDDTEQVRLCRLFTAPLS